MSGHDMVVDRTINSVDFDRLEVLTKKFNENHKRSNLRIKTCTKDKIELNYESKNGSQLQPFSTYREAERWIRYMTYADID